MPIHALLGATGGTGSAILRSLLSSQIPDLHINILIRSKTKLLQAFPQLDLTPSSAITIFEGSISNSDTLKACLSGASTIYVCVSTNHATRTVSIARTTAASLTTALSSLRDSQGPSSPPPVLLFNRSLSLNPSVQLPGPALFKKLFLSALWNIYADLVEAETVYATAAQGGLLTLITADAPGLMDPEGTQTTGYTFLLRGTASATLSYADFGAAMVELGQRRGEFEGKAVGVSATGEVKFVFWANLWIVLRGWGSRLVPF